MSVPIGFHDIKKQASFFFKEKIRTARLALTDVTPVQLLAEEATNGNSSAPDAKTMRLISRAAFEIDDYCRIVAILRRRLAKFEKKQWREAYYSLVILEHLLTHGPERIADEFESINDTIHGMCKFQLVDERGFNWGSAVQKKSEKVLKLLQKGPLFREERDRARKISCGIQGFGSLNQNSTRNCILPGNGNDNENREKSSSNSLYGRSMSLSLYAEDQKENLNLGLGFGSSKEDENWNCSSSKEKESSNNGLEEVKRENGVEKMDDHPFSFGSRESLLLLSQG